MIRHGLIVLIFIMSGITMIAQKYEYNDYYYQRKSLFEVLPVDSNDIVFLGNSLTNNGHWNEIFNIPNAKNRGIISDVIQGVYDRVDLVTSGKPKKIFLLIGVNDISHHIGADSIAFAIDNLVAKIRRDTPNTKLYLQSLLPINNDFKRYRNLVGTEDVFTKANVLLEKVANKYNITWINTWNAFADNEQKLIKYITADGLHLKPEGYKIWREELAKYVFDKPIASFSDDVYTITPNDIVFAGNSLTTGCEWNEILNVDNIKVRSIGETSDCLVNNIESIAKNKPKAIYLLSSYNSLDSTFCTDAVVKNMLKAVQRIKVISPNTLIYLQGLIPLNSNYKKYSWFADNRHKVELANERLRNIAKKEKIKWVNLYPALADDNGELCSEYTNDGYHLMGAGYIAWRNALKKYFRK